MPETFARIASIVLAFTFAWAAFSKLAALSRWVTVLGRYGVPEKSKGVVGLLVPLAELMVAVTILFVSARVGAVLVVGCLAIFSLAILRARASTGDRLPCGCFGGSNERHYTTMMWRNAILAILAAVVLSSRSDLDNVLPSAPDSGEALPALLAGLGVALLLWIAWQTAVSLRRREHH